MSAPEPAQFQTTTSTRFPTQTPLFAHHLITQPHDGFFYSTTNPAKETRLTRKVKPEQVGRVKDGARGCADATELTANS